MNLPDLTHEQIVERCIELDNKPGLIVYVLSTTPPLFKFSYAAYSWSSLTESERYCMVKNQSYFLSEDEVQSARNLFRQVMQQ